jgi:hypothetical protein
MPFKPLKFGLHLTQSQKLVQEARIVHISSLCGVPEHPPTHRIGHLKHEQMCGVVFTQ